VFCNLLNAMTLNTLSSKLGETTHIFFKKKRNHQYNSTFGV
jgi:hypothetical protein